MGLLDEGVNSSPAQLCPKCKDGVVIKDRFGNISCTMCELKISKGGMVRGFSLDIVHKKTMQKLKRDSRRDIIQSTTKNYKI